MKRFVAALLLLSQIPLPSLAQSRQHTTSSVTVYMSADLASNANSTGVVASVGRKQLGNFGTGCSSGVIQPTGVPVGQLYVTSAVQSAAVSAGCPSNGVVATTASGTGIASPANGFNAGGNDSATSMTDTYGDTAYDSICTGDPHHNDPTLFPGLAPAGCDTSASAYFAEVVSGSHPNADVLYPSNYATNSTTLDSANWYMRSFYAMWDNVTGLWDSEHDVNLNSSPTAYAQSGCSASGTVTKPCGYHGWGMHWGKGISMWATCPQNCSGWHKMLWKNMRGGSDVTTWTPIVNHWYHIIQYGHRNMNCSYGSTSNCYFYDFFTVYDVTAGGAPQTYYDIDTTTSKTPGGIPVNHSSWSSGLTPQVQLDATTGTTIGVHIVSDVTKVFSVN